MNRLNISYLKNGVEENRDQLMQLLKKYGQSCMAYSTLQPGLKYCLIPDRGYAAWIDCRLFPGARAHRVILSNPIGPEAVQLEIISKLTADRERITLVMIDRNLADKLYAEGFKVYRLGVKTEIDIPGYDLRGRKKSQLRQWCNKASREGTIVFEEKLSRISPDELESLCRQWLSGKGGYEMSFLTRPLPDRDEEGVRFFWARKKGRLVGMAGFDPMFRDAEAVGYYHNFDRLAPEASTGTSAYLVLSAMEVFRSEGAQKLSLGLSPLLDIKSEYNLTGPLKFIAESIFKYGEKLYPFKGNIQHKSKYRGVRKPVYVASNGNWIETMLAAGTACGFTP